MTIQLPEYFNLSNFRSTMKNCRQIVVDLEREIHLINLNAKTVFEEIETGIDYCKTACDKLKKIFLSKSRIIPEQESEFFKTIKPIPIGYLIYFLNLADFEINRPQSSAKKIKKYIQENIIQYQAYFIEHKTFYQYLERQRTDRDAQYFIRSKSLIKFHPDALLYCMDQNFSTSHDFIVAKIFAHKLLIKRFNNELYRLRSPYQKQSANLSKNLKWTGSKVDLIELIYALQAVGSINNGKAEIKELANTLQTIFNIELGDYYRTFIEIRARKINNTKFLDRLKQNLQNKMDLADE